MRSSLLHSVKHKKIALEMNRVQLQPFPLTFLPIFSAAMPKEGDERGSCAPCPFLRGAEGGGRSALLYSTRTKHKSSWNGHLNGQRGLFSFKIARLQHFATFRLVDFQLMSDRVLKACLPSPYFNKTQVLFDFLLFYRMYFVVKCPSKNVCPLRPSMLPPFLFLRL